MADRDEDDRRQPTHHAYTVIKHQGRKDYWVKIGSVFPHKDGKGFNVTLQAAPLDGKIVCRDIGDEPDDEPEQPPARQDRNDCPTTTATPGPLRARP
jgi:hypothetical protein